MLNERRYLNPDADEPGARLDEAGIAEAERAPAVSILRGEHGPAGARQTWAERELPMERRADAVAAPN